MGRALDGELNLPGRLIRMTGAARFFRSGSSFEYLMRWWHPVSWLAWLGALAMLGIVGLMEGEVSRAVPFRLSPYWRERKDEIEWI